MAVVFLLGPGMWDQDKRIPSDSTPMQTRRMMAKILRSHRHEVILMEEDPDRKGEDLIEKFDRLLMSDVTDVIVYWPPLAKMQTTYDEFILLCDRHEFINRNSIDIWVLHHHSVASIKQNEFRILETGNRSRYLTAVIKLGVHPLEWESEEDLKEQIYLLSSELN